MLGVGEYNQVLKSVVQTVSVDVVNMLVSGELSSQMFLHDIPVLAHLDAVHDYSSVLMLWPVGLLEAMDRKKLTQMALGQTASRTKLDRRSNGFSLDAPQGDCKLSFAPLTGSYFFGAFAGERTERLTLISKRIGFWSIKNFSTTATGTLDLHTPIVPHVAIALNSQRRSS